MKIQRQNLFSIRNKMVHSNFEIKTGVNVLLGQNGIGKTTFFHYLKQHRRDFFGDEKCAFMDQFPLAPIAELSGREVLSILRSEIKTFDENLVDHMIAQFSFEKLLDSKVENYSGGENQVFKFILMLAQRATFYFLDEPLQYLDDINTQNVLETLQGLESKKILIIEHRKEKLYDYNFSIIQMKNYENSIEITND